MPTFTVTELPRTLEPVTRDTFVADLAPDSLAPAPRQGDAAAAPARRRIYD